MSDIFEIKKRDVFLKVKGVEYQLADPPLPKRIALLRKSAELDESKDKINPLEFLAQANELNIENIKLFLPTMPDDVLNEIGGAELNAYLSKIMELVSQKFGAVVEKLEAK